MHIGGAPHFGGARVGGVPHFAGRPAMPRAMARPSFHAQPPSARPHFAGRPAFRSQHSIARQGNRFAAQGNARFDRNQRRAGFSANPTLSPNRHANVRAGAVRHALSSHAFASALHSGAALRNPETRTRLVATAATAGRINGSREGGWWRHRNGGYGWVGPVFWPLAFYDIYDYTWGYGYDEPFWDYGYGDIYAGIFSPYGYDDLSGYFVQGGGGHRVARRRGSDPRTATPDQLAQMCGEDSRAIAGLPVDQIQQAIEPNEAQRAALEDLANAYLKAAQKIKAACPTRIAVTAPARLADMQARIEAMISAVVSVQPTLQRFYDLLSDEQKARLNALGQDLAPPEAAKDKSGSIVANCGASQAGTSDWPMGEIEARVHPTEVQRASLKALQDATAKAADMLKAACQPSDAITPPARLEAVRIRLNIMLHAVKTVRAALDDFYSKLSDEQKAQFEAIGPRRSAASDQPSTTEPYVRRHHAGYGGHIHHANVGHMIRHLLSMARW
jgi:hypothetical protein